MIRLLIIALLFAGCAVKQNKITPKEAPTQRPYAVNGKMYYPMKSIKIGWTQRGLASWYGPDFHGRYTSNGEVYNMYAYTAAHKTLPMNTIVKVTNLKNGKSVIVRINDRGPFVKGRIIDLSYAAGKKIGLDVLGVAPVKLKVIAFKGKSYVKGYMIQIGAYLNPSSAQKLAKKYQKLGYNTVVLKTGRYYKIYIKGFRSYDEAKKFQIIHKINGFIIGE